MAEISASVVVKLRKMTGQGMMDCKHALEEANGDMEKAVDILRKKGLATLAKRAERETSQGRVVSSVGKDGRMVALATLCCETDFVANSDDFIAAAATLGNYALACEADEGTENLMGTKVNGKTLQDVVAELVSKTGEKTEVGDYVRYRLDGPGLIEVYIHFNKKIGTMVQIDCSDDKTAQADAMKRVAADVAMHITATKPLSLDKNGINPDTIAREKAIFSEQVKGKPANIIDKIVDGKMQKFYAENCLLEQAFVKDDSKTVAQVLAEAAKAAGGQAKIRRFSRFDVV